MTINDWFSSTNNKSSSSLSSFSPTLLINSFTSEENIDIHRTVLDRKLLTLYWFENEKGHTESAFLISFFYRVKELNRENHKVHLCVNTSNGNRRTIQNIKTLNCLAIDLDSPDIAIVLKLVEFLKKEYNLTSFIVNSGNGYHIYIPIGEWEIPEGKQIEFNEKSKAFWNKVKIETNIGIDNTADISRVLTLAGSLNTKNPTNPLPVFFLNPDNLSFTDFVKKVNESKPHNLAIIQTIFETLEVDLTKTNKPISRSWSDRKCQQKEKREFASPEDIFSKQQNSLAFCMKQDFKLAEIIGKELVMANGNQGSDDFQLIRHLDFFNFGEAEKVAIFMKYRVYLPDGQPREKFRLESVNYYLDRMLRNAVSGTHFGDREREIPLWV